MSQYEFLQIETHLHVAVVSLNRPKKANALGEKIWREIGQFFRTVDCDREIRAIVLNGAGQHFCAGIDFEFFQVVENQVGALPEGVKQEKIRDFILGLQADFTALEVCRKPVIAAVHGQCIGAGVDLVSACDIRFCTKDSQFSVKEVDLAIVADVGTLQRLPKLVPEGIARELALTGREFSGQEAESWGFANHAFGSREEMLEKAIGVAKNIGQKSPLAVRGIKQQLNYSRDHSVAEGLDYVATWNGGVLLSQDLMITTEAIFSGKKPEYPNS